MVSEQHVKPVFTLWVIEFFNDDSERCNVFATLFGNIAAGNCDNKTDVLKHLMNRWQLKPLGKFLDMSKNIDFFS